FGVGEVFSKHGWASPWYLSFDQVPDLHAARGGRRWSCKSLHFCQRWLDYSSGAWPDRDRGDAEAVYFFSAPCRKARSVMSFGSVETGASRHSQRIISGMMAPPYFCPWR